MKVENLSLLDNLFRNVLSNPFNSTQCHPNLEVGAPVKPPKPESPRASENAQINTLTQV